MDQFVRIRDRCVPSAHIACVRFSNYPYWIFLSKLCKGDVFPGINSAAQLFVVGYIFLVLDMNRFFYKTKMSIDALIACSLSL